MDKRTLVERFRALLLGRQRSLEASLAATRSGMRVDGDFRPENRGERAAVTSQGYLAAGLNRRLTELVEALDLLDKVDPGPRERVIGGALVTVADEEGEERRYLLLPGGQGDKLQTKEGVVTVLSPTSPLARALRGRREGDEAGLRLEGRMVELEVLEVL